jgi:hypothetical protein
MGINRLLTTALALLILLSAGTAAQAETEVKMSGDFRLHMNSWTNYNFTGRDPTGTMVAQPLSIYERFQLQSDFVTNENLKFRFQARLNDAAWGKALAVDNPPVAVQVSNAYLIFTVPNTSVEVDAGYQNWQNPVSSYFAGGLVLDTQVAALAVTAPIVADTFALKFGYLRPRNTYSDFAPNTTGGMANVDVFYLAGALTTDPINITPWAAYGLIGREADLSPSSIGAHLSPAIPATVGLPAAWGNDSNSAFWLGAAIEVKALDPVKFYADVIYGNAASGDHSYDARRGWFMDAALEYNGLELMTPSVWGYWSSGDTGGISGGSQRLPYLVSSWNAGGSFLFNDDAGEWYNDKMSVSQVGSWGLGITFDKITFIKDLSHRLTFNFVNGTNSPQSLREGILLGGIGTYYGMGNDIATSEWVYGVSLDNKYMIYENLAMYANLGWAHGNFDSSIWGRSFVNLAQNGDVWRVLLGFKYTF